MEFDHSFLLKMIPYNAVSSYKPKEYYVCGEKYNEYGGER
jgi:hypothetical protein